MSISLTGIKIKKQAMKRMQEMPSAASQVPGCIPTLSATFSEGLALRLSSSPKIVKASASD